MREYPKSRAELQQLAVKPGLRQGVETLFANLPATAFTIAGIPSRFKNQWIVDECGGATDSIRTAVTLYSGV